jgi:hypothetical protein
MSQVAAAAEAVREQLEGFHPENGPEFDRFVSELPQLYEAIGLVFARLGDRLGSDFPIDPHVVASLQELGAHTAAMQSMAEETYKVHRRQHEDEMRRYEEPRPGEEMWDVRGT